VLLIQVNAIPNAAICLESLYAFRNSMLMKLLRDQASNYDILIKVV